MNRKSMSILTVMALLIVACGGGGGSGAAPDSIVLSLDGGSETTYYERSDGGFPDAIITSSIVTTPVTYTLIAAMFDHAYGSTYDTVLTLTIGGTSTGDYPIDGVLYNEAMYWPADSIFQSDTSGAQAGTITVDVYDSDRIQGVFAVNMEEMGNTSNKLRVEGSFDLKPGM